MRKRRNGYAQNYLNPNMPLPFDLVQKLYAAHFPYSWITWEGKLWEDPENQPGLGALVRECNSESMGNFSLTGPDEETNEWTACADNRIYSDIIPEISVTKLYL